MTTDAQLAAPCRVCDKPWGTHPVRKNRCEFIMDACSLNYEQAESNRYRCGVWSQAEWEAYSNMHTSTFGYPLSIFDREVAELMVGLCDYIAKARGITELVGEFGVRHQAARDFLENEPPKARRIGDAIFRPIQDLI